VIYVRKLLPFLRPYWKRALLALVLLTTLVFLDLSIPRLIQRIIDQGILQHNQAVVVQTALLMLGISVLSAVIAIGNNNLSVQVGESVARDLREGLFLKIQTYSYGNLDRQQTGQLMVRLTSDTAAIQRLTQVSLRIGTRAPLLMIGSLILMINTSPSLAFTMLPLLLITSAVIVFLIVKMEPLFRSVQQKLDRLNTVLQENIAGVRLVKAFARADFESARFESANENFTDHSVKVMRFMSISSPALTVFVNIGMVVVIWVGGLQAIRGEMSVGQIVAFTNYLLTTMGPLTMMTMLSNAWANGLASARRVNEILDTVPEVQDQPDAVPLPDATPARIAFEHVAFHYNGNLAEAALEDINLVAEPGQTVAILGATGTGKSTLINLIPRFYDVSSGRVTVDGVDVRQLRHDSLLAAIGIVPQETVLFSGTVRDNIRYGNPAASDDQVIAAAQAAQAHEFIMALSQGYDTHVEQRGANFSGGQKQRIAIARALLTQPKILILDDSTSSVDVETETKIQDALDAQIKSVSDTTGGATADENARPDRHCEERGSRQSNLSQVQGIASSGYRPPRNDSRSVLLSAGPPAPFRTTLVVAQRISTVLKADKIVVIDRGRIVAEGTHRELLQTSPVYQEIYESQLGNGYQALRLEEEAGAGQDGSENA
jgi:ATP-binding cassette, subfamily B, multidrug efflux pump